MGVMERDQHIRAFTRTIWRWFSCHRRDLPWRHLPVGDPLRRAYLVLVSEVMLQQTPVSRVQNVFRDFLVRFPSFEDLARASNREVLLAWRGMGHNRRALQLRDAAKDFPANGEDLTRVPGIGAYTAAAIRTFAWNLETSCLDTNIRRVLHRTFFGPERFDGTWRVGDRTLLALAARVLEVALVEGKRLVQRGELSAPMGLAAEWHAALMDFGALVQTKKNPKWEECPLTRAGLCKAALVRGQKRHKRQKGRVRVRREPGREVLGTFIPNRIFRGRIVEMLRDAPSGLTLALLGKKICPDWNRARHERWLRGLVAGLKRDHLLMQRGVRLALSE